MLRKPKLSAAASAAFLAVALVACGSPTKDTSSQSPPSGSAQRPVVLTTFTVLQDIGQNVAGEHLVVESITKPGAEIHGYEPTPSDIARAADADLILDNGLGLELWFEQFVSELDVPHRVVSEGVEPIMISEDAYQGMPNPHAWMSPLNVQVYVDNMVAAFSEIDPRNAADYRANGESYKAQLQDVQDDLASKLADLPQEQRALVTCEGAFSYLARDAGLTEKYIWAVGAEQQATPRQMVSAIDFVQEKGIPAAFCESTLSDKPMRQIVSGTDADFGGTLYVDSLSEADGPVPTYLDLIRYDAETIAAGLTGKSAS